MSKDYAQIIANIEAQFTNLVSLNDEIKTIQPVVALNANATQEEVDANEALKADRAKKVSIKNFLVMKLIHTMNESFPAPKTTDEGEMDEVEFAAVREFFNGNETKTAWEVIQEWHNVPATILGTVIIVAVMRDLLAVQRVQFDPSVKFQVKGVEVDPWRVFADRYTRLVLAA